MTKYIIISCQVVMQLIFTCFMGTTDCNSLILIHFYLPNLRYLIYHTSNDQSVHIKSVLDYKHTDVVNISKQN